MKNLVVIIGTGIVLFIACVLVLMPLELGEVQTTVSIIKPLPADYNPYQRLYDKMLYPTVRINTKDGIGSGVIISATDSTDWILTAAHVVGKESEVRIEIFNQKENLSDLCAFVVMTDTNKDLALLCALCPSREAGSSDSVVKTAKLASKNYKPYIFTEIWTVGCSLGLVPRPSSGHICVISGDHWEVSSPILPGNSGGPVYDAKTHEVIGIAVWVKTYYGQLITTMAGVVPIQTIYEFLEQSKKIGGE